MKRSHFLLLLIAVPLTGLYGSTESETQDLFEAIRKQDISRVAQLISQDNSLVLKRNGWGETPLTFVIITPVQVISQVGWRERIATLLLNAGADTEATNRPCQTPLMLAARTRNYALLDLFVKLGAIIDAKNSQGDTVLSQAFGRAMPGCLHKRAGQLHLEVAIWLLKHGACLDEKSLTTIRECPQFVESHYTQLEKDAAILISQYLDKQLVPNNIALGPDILRLILSFVSPAFNKLKSP